MKLSELVERLDGRLEGDGEKNVERIGSLRDAGPEDISFLSDARYASEVAESKAAAIIVPEDFDQTTEATLLFVADVNEAMDKLLLLFAPEADLPAVGVHPSAIVDDSAQLGNDVAVGAGAVIGAGVVVGSGSEIFAGCVLGRDVRIGEKCRLWPNVVINQNCILGNNVTIFANSTIGTDGFGYRMVGGEHRKIPHIGIVVIEDDVEIGSNCCVDRAKFGRTVVGRGTKVDNLVQIAHNVQIGKHCIMAAQSVIAGSSELGNYVVMSGQSGISDHVQIGDGVMLGPRAGITSNNKVESGAKLMGVPHRPFRTFFREMSLVQKLPEMAKEIKQLRKLIEKNASSKDHS